MPVGMKPPAAPNRGPRCEIQPFDGKAPTYLGEETFLGYRSFKYQHPPAVFPDGKSIRTTSWYVKDLNCYEVKQHGDSVDANGQVTGTYDKFVTQITAGVPDGALFSIPSSYREVPPSEMEIANLRIKITERGEPEALDRLKEKLQQQWADEDKRYWDAKQVK
jgi:hypothetical protein